MSRLSELIGGVEDNSPTYPGSKQRRDAMPTAVPGTTVYPFEGVKPRVYQVRGVDTEFFTVGQLAAALGRKAVTIRKWEADGVIPKATFQAPNPSQDARARRRLYTRAQCEGIVRIADSECIPPFGTVLISESRFTERVTALFKELQSR